MPAIESTQIQAMSYRYLRIALIGLLLALAAAVFYQSSQQDSFLASVSAYYYTPAQAVFVGALVGLGASMIALQGMTPPEDVFLNLGGMFAIVVAIIPTGRGADFRTAVQACRESGGALLTQRASPRLDCPTVQALEDATRANVENNMAALLIVGGLAIVLTAAILGKGWRAERGAEGRWWVVAGSVAAFAAWLGGLIVFLVSVDWLAGHAHYIAAIGLLLSILAVAGANARRRGQGPGAAGVARRDILKSPGTYPYVWTAIAMLVLSGGLIVLWLVNAVSLFWVEISVAFLFAFFWTVQTVELERQFR